MHQITIAIDGHSSTGKSTVAKQLADYLGYVYVDTGAMYRAVTLYALQKGFVSENHLDKETLIAALPDIELHFEKNTDGKAEIFLNGTNVEKDIRTLEVSEYVSPIATVSEVRKKLVEQQQKMGDAGGVVLAGDDVVSKVVAVARTIGDAPPHEPLGARDGRARELDRPVAGVGTDDRHGTLQNSCRQLLPDTSLRPTMGTVQSAGDHSADRIVRNYQCH